MSNACEFDDFHNERMDCGDYPPEIMYFEDQQYDPVERKFTGNINYSPSSMQGYKIAKFVMIFAFDFSLIEFGFRTTDADNFKKSDSFGKWKHFRYRKYIEGEAIPEWQILKEPPKY